MAGCSGGVVRRRRAAARQDEGPPDEDRPQKPPPSRLPAANPDHAGRPPARPAPLRFHRDRRRTTDRTRPAAGPRGGHDQPIRPRPAGTGSFPGSVLRGRGPGRARQGRIEGQPGGTAPLAGSGDAALRWRHGRPECRLERPGHPTPAVGIERHRPSRHEGPRATRQAQRLECPVDRRDGPLRPRSGRA